MMMMKTMMFGMALLTAACGADDSDGGGPSPPDAPGSGSSVGATVEWTIRRNGVASSCQATNALEVWVTLRPENGLERREVFQCLLVPGMADVPAGRYAVSAELRDMDYQVLATASQQAVTVPASGAAPVVRFTFDSR